MITTNYNVPKAQSFNFGSGKGNKLGKAVGTDLKRVGDAIGKTETAKVIKESNFGKKVSEFYKKEITVPEIEKKAAEIKGKLKKFFS